MPAIIARTDGGETYDARLEIPGFGAPDPCPDAHPDSPSCPPLPPLPEAVAAAAYEDPSTAHAVLSSQMMAPIRALQLLPPKEITNPHPGVQVVDFGQNIAGWGRLSLKKCPAGLQLKLSFAEVLHQTTHPGTKCNGHGNAEVSRTVIAGLFFQSASDVVADRTLLRACWTRCTIAPGSRAW